MQNEIAAPSAGMVTALHVGPGQAVAAGAKLATLAPIDS
jgi:biotin carboxyl carrier protein